MKKLLQSLVLVPLATLALVGCNKKEESTINETTPLIFSSEEVDGVFNPFYSTTGADSTIVGMTQLSLISNDKNGNPTYGEDEAVAALDYQTVTNGSGNNQTTTYYFVLKNNVKYSNGSPLTIKDVLFNLYVYLDPVYTGSTTIYSTDIVGLQAYRTQSEDESVMVILLALVCGLALGILIGLFIERAKSRQLQTALSLAEREQARLQAVTEAMRVQSEQDARLLKQAEEERRQQAEVMKSEFMR